MRAGARTRRIVPGAAIVAWGLVLLAAGLEVIWALVLTEAGGLDRPWWALGGIALAIISLVMLMLALPTLPLGSAYAVWVGTGAVGVVLAGVIILGEPLSFLRAGCLALIVAGVIGLTLTDTSSNAARRDETTGDSSSADEHQGAVES